MNVQSVIEPDHERKLLDGSKSSMNMKKPCDDGTLKIAEQTQQFQIGGHAQDRNQISSITAYFEDAGQLDGQNTLESSSA